MDSKLYIAWRETLKKYIVKYKGDVISEHGTQDQAEDWVMHNYPSHGYEIERVIKRKNSPRGSKVGEWR